LRQIRTLLGAATDGTGPACAETRVMATTAKTYEFPVEVHWLEGRLTLASVEGKPDLDVATPPEFKHGIPGVWSPEDLLVASAAACYAVTLVAIAERRGVPVRDLGISARGTVGQRSEGPLAFTGIELDVELVTGAGYEEEARDAGEAAERSCLIAASLDVPIQLALTVRAAQLWEAHA
jgi:organic hydroperoxide reductase OsmC/OhrA